MMLTVVFVVVAVMALKGLRERRGWSQAELARRARLHPADISRIESGRLVPYDRQRRRLARALGVSEEALESGGDDEHKSDA